VTNECLRFEGGLGKQHEKPYCSMDVERCG